MGTQKKEDRNRLYRLTLIDDETHERIRSYRFRRIRLILAAVTAAVVLLVGIYCLIAFTPLKTTIPGYPDAHAKRLAVSNAIRIDSLENVITRWEIYSENLSRVLTGDETLSLDSIIMGNTTRYLRSKSEEELARRDSLLREEVAKEEQFGLGGANKKNVPLEGMHLFTPVKGVVTNEFDPIQHPWLEISAPEGSVALSILSGTVIYADWSDSDLYTIAVQHEGNLVSICRGNRKLLRTVSDKVGAGTPIALVSGSSKFGMWLKGEPVDPAKFISF